MINLAFRDIFMAVAAIFLVLALLPHRPDFGERDDSQVPAQGQLSVTMVWPPGMDIDVDLWVLHPKSLMPVGWSNKGDRECNLLRDDLGARGDKDPVEVNFEQTQCRQLAVGEYIINAHYYGGEGRNTIMDVPVSVEVRFVSGRSSVVADTYTTTLSGWKDEVTLSRFIIGSDGNIVDDISRQFENLVISGDDPGGSYGP